MNWATDTLRYHLEISPFVGFKRPQYFNERDRRLRGDEGDRLIASVRKEDEIRSFKIAVENEVDRMRALGSPRRGKAWNKYFLMQARKRVRVDIARNGYLHIPLWEVFFEFLLATASRRGEELSLLWKNTHLEDQAALYPDTKNGRSRAVPLRQHVIELLNQIPREPDEDRVFPMSEDEVEGAWQRICRRAGIKDYHIHDNRHEAISAAAEAGRSAGMPFDTIALARLSGHRDLRMLSRYSHLCAGELAHSLDEVHAAARRRHGAGKGGPRIARPGGSPNGPIQADDDISENIFDNREVPRLM